MMEQPREHTSNQRTGPTEGLAKVAVTLGVAAYLYRRWL